MISSQFLQAGIQLIAVDISILARHTSAPTITQPA
jgi:hypothetical protein